MHPKDMKLYAAARAKYGVSATEAGRLLEPVMDRLFGPDDHPVSAGWLVERVMEAMFCAQNQCWNQLEEEWNAVGVQTRGEGQ